MDRLPDDNPFARIADAYASHPESLRQPLVTRAVGETIPFVATAGCYVDTYTPTRVTVSLDERRAVENHIGGMHAAALALLAETASGLVVALNVTPPGVPLLRTMNVDFRRVASGRVTATATLTEADAETIASRPVGRMDVNVRIEDASGEEPVEAVLQWAWLPKSKLQR